MDLIGLSNKIRSKHDRLKKQMLAQHKRQPMSANYSVESVRGSIISPDTIKSVNAFITPGYKHRSQEEIQLAVQQISEVVDSWALAHANEILPALQDLRLRLAKLKGGDELVKKFENQKQDEDVLGSVDTSVSVPVQVTEPVKTDMTTKLKPIREMNHNLPYSPLLSDSLSNEVPRIHAESVHEMKNSLDFSVLVGNGLTNLHVEADAIRKRNEMTQLVKDIMILLCDMSLF
jgi:hypothetical protein